MEYPRVPGQFDDMELDRLTNVCIDPDHDYYNSNTNNPSGSTNNAGETNSSSSSLKTTGSSIGESNSKHAGANRPSRETMKFRCTCPRSYMSEHDPNNHADNPTGGGVKPRGRGESSGKDFHHIHRNKKAIRGKDAHQRYHAAKLGFLTKHSETCQNNYQRAKTIKSELQLIMYNKHKVNESKRMSAKVPAKTWLNLLAALSLVRNGVKASRKVWSAHDGALIIQRRWRKYVKTPSQNPFSKSL